MISIIVAFTKNNRAIGKNNTLPWHISDDLKRFKELTTGNVVIMGKNTYLSIVNMLGKPLPNRENIVISSSLDKSTLPNEVHLAKTFNEAIDLSKRLGEKVFIIGGQQVYETAINDTRINEILATVIEKDVDGDAFFPNIDTNDWEIIDIKDGENSEINYQFITYRRKNESL